MSPRRNNQEMKNKILKWGAIIGSSAFLLFVVVRVSKPLLLSLAHYIVRVYEKPQGEEYQAHEVAVETEVVKSMTMPKYVNTVGELKAAESVVLYSEMSGRISKIQFEEGTVVHKGDVLIKFDDEQAQAELKYRKAKLDMAKLEFERQKKMHDSGVGKGQDYDKAAAELNMAESEVAVSEASLKKTEIVAPFDGTIGLIEVGVGTFIDVNQHQALVTLVDQNSMKVRFGVPGTFIGDIGVGQAIELRTESCKDRVFHGTVEAVDSHVDPATNSIFLRASVSNEDGALKAGLYADVMLVIGEQGDTITVDESAVERSGEQEFVWVVDNDKARRVSVMTGVRNKGRIEIVAGLKEGQVVVIAGQLRLYEGALVKQVKDADKALGGIDEMDAMMSGFGV